MAPKFVDFPCYCQAADVCFPPVNHTGLFIVNGLGMGNSTRCHAVMEHLIARGWKIHLLTSGNGLNYFKDKGCVDSFTEIEPFFYSGQNGGVSGWATLKSIAALGKIARRKNAQLEELMNRVKPSVAVIDSEYMIYPLRKRGIPVVGLNTSEMIVSRYLKARQVPKDIRSHFWVVEYSDYLFHRLFCDLVLSPFPQRTPTRHRKFKRIGLIVRRSLLERVAAAPPSTFPAPRSLREVVFMLSGSVHASNILFSGRQFPFKIHVVGRDGESTENVIFHGRQMNNIDLLARADALVINGGYSAVSEAFALRKPVFVVPVAGHAEQFINASLVHELGLGHIASEADVLDQLARACETNSWAGLKPLPPAFETDGAREAAEAIIRLAEERAGKKCWISPPYLRDTNALPRM